MRVLHLIYVVVARERQNGLAQGGSGGENLIQIFVFVVTTTGGLVGFIMQL
jgi:hypothetical protein